MKRRQFVQTLAAGSALGSLGLVTGCGLGRRAGMVADATAVIDNLSSVDI
jgi:hypothetical protein